MNHTKTALRGRLTNKRLGELLALTFPLSSLASAACQRRCNITILISLFVTTRWTVVNEQLALDFLTPFLQRVICLFSVCKTP